MCARRNDQQHPDDRVDLTQSIQTRCRFPAATNGETGKQTLHKSLISCFQPQVPGVPGTESFTSIFRPRFDGSVGPGGWRSKSDRARRPYQSRERQGTAFHHPQRVQKYLAEFL
jgi:hypothetical protein